MIAGQVRGDEGIIRLTIKGSGRRQQECEAIIDTGYTGSLTLPSAVISALALKWLSVGRGQLADGSDCLFDVYEANVVWDRKVRRVLISETEADPLVGMALLEGFELKMQVQSGGKITIKRLTG